MKKVTLIGVDLAKNVYQLHGAAEDGSVIFRKNYRAFNSQNLWHNNRFVWSQWRPPFGAGISRRYA